MTFKIEISDAVTQKGKKVAVATIQGRLDSSVTIEMRRQLQQVVDFGYPNVLLNLAGVSSFDSSGIGILISCLRKCRTAGGNLALSCIPEIVAVTLEAASMESSFASFPNNEVAVANFPQEY